MASSTFGIPQLLHAEKRAKEKVTDARKAKQFKLKAAKEEANSEVEVYKKQADKAFKEQEKEILGSRDDMKHKQDQHEATEKERIANKTHENKQDVIDSLIKLVCEVQPKLHINYKVSA